VGPGRDQLERARLATPILIADLEDTPECAAADDAHHTVTTVDSRPRCHRRCHPSMTTTLAGSVN